MARAQICKKRVRRTALVQGATGLDKIVHDEYVLAVWVPVRDSNDPLVTVTDSVWCIVSTVY
jgi:hypothetical protein